MSLKEIFDLLNGAYVAQNCFGKSRQWFHQRLSGSLVNGKPAEFTPEQKAQLAAYLRQKAREMEEIATELDQ